MFPARQLSALADRKAFLRQRIALRRARAVIEARRVARPLHAADAVLARWRQLSPLVKTLGGALALWGGRKIVQRRRAGGPRGWLGTALRLAPLAFALLRGRRRA